MATGVWPLMHRDFLAIFYLGKDLALLDYLLVTRALQLMVDVHICAAHIVHR